MEWHSILDPNSPELDRLAAQYGLHPLHIEDCRHRGQASKIEEGESYLFTVLKLIRLDKGGAVETGDLDIFLGRDFLITVLEDDSDQAQSLIEQLRAASPAGERPDQAYYRLVDNVIDSYLPALDRLDDIVDALEDESLAEPAPATLAAIFDTKRSLIVLRRVLVNTRDVAGHLQRTESPLIHREMWPFLRDIYDHVARNLDTVEMLRDLLNGSLDVYLSSVANRTNQVMKVLTVLGTVALPSLVVSGIYGMNVRGLPGAESIHGIALVLGAMVCSTGALLCLLKRFRWF